MVAFLPYVMWGDSESASKNTSNPVKIYFMNQFLTNKKLKISAVQL